MNLRHLEVFITVVEYGSVTRASEKLYVAQPSVSQTISELEKEYNVKLFERLNKRLYLTEIGRAVYDKAKVLIKDFNIVDKLLRDNSLINAIRIGASVTVGNCLLGDILNGFKNSHNVTYDNVIVGNTEKIIKNVLDGLLDVAIVEGAVDNENLTVEIVCSDDVVLVAGVDYNAEQTIINNFIVREIGSGTRDLAIACVKEAGFKYYKLWEVSSTQAILDMLRVSGCATGISKRLVADKIRDGELKMLSEVCKHRHFYIIRHKDKVVSKVMDNFYNYIAQAFK